jgi:signal recognition particle subunit SRP54
MGDILSLVEDARSKVDEKEAQKLADKIKKGKDFDLDDFRMQIQQMKNMGGMASVMDKLPAQLGQMAAASPDLQEKALKRTQGIIDSMTPAERRKPELLKASRKRRIATGAGVQVQEVNRLLKQFEQMQKMMKMMRGGNLQKMMRSLKGMAARDALTERLRAATRSRSCTIPSAPTPASRRTGDSQR